MASFSPVRHRRHGVGDCGSCSASAVADGCCSSRADPRGRHRSDAFTVSADAMADLRGAPGYRYVTTAHRCQPDPDGVRARAAQAVPAIVALLTQPVTEPACRVLMTAPVTDPVAQAKAAIEYCYEQGWTDGLPVVPATRADMRLPATTERDPAEIIGSQPHLGRSITVAQAAANAIMPAQADTSRVLAAGRR